MKLIVAGLAMTSIFFCLSHTSSHAALTSWGLDKNAYTSDFMIGNVVVAVVFPESDGSVDPNIENWSDERKTQALSQIMAGLDWWTKQNPHSPLSFTFVTKTVSTRYEPITRPYYDEALWIPDVMSKLGYNSNRFTATRNYVNDLRKDYKADWGYVIFVVDSQVDANGKFADGLFAYAYLGGPFLVLTYDNNGYGISNMGVVAAHETGHIFHALDEYAGASGPNDYSSGYFSTVNGNHAYSSVANEPNSIMRGGLRWGLDDWVRQMVGWRDSDKNDRDDILDLVPVASITQQSNQSGSSGSTGFTGDAAVSILPRQSNAQGYGLTIDNVAKVEYRLKNGDWAQATPMDGVFDSATESFQITVAPSGSSAQTIRIQDVELRVATSFSIKSGTTVTSSAGGTPATLEDAHAFPNPFKPNSSLGHSNVTFTSLTPGSKVQLFTVAGEPVFDKEAAAGSTTLSWNVVNNDGQEVTSGVYYYLITDSSGHKKKGKIAVIR